MTTRDSKGRFASASKAERLAAAMKAIVRRSKASPVHVEPDSHDVSARQAAIAKSLADRGLSPEVTMTEQPQSIEELRACIMGRCRGASQALTDIMRADPLGQSVTYREAMARYAVWTQARTMLQCAIDAEAKARPGFFARLFGRR